jgi:Galactose oxidase, central domain
MIPCGRKGHSMQYWSKHDAILLVSGRTAEGEFLSDLHLYFLERNFWFGLAVPARYLMRHNFGVNFFLLSWRFINI